MLTLARTIDVLNERVGYYNSFLIIALLAVVSYEVVMRYGLNAPTIWAFEATTFIYSVHFILAFADTHRQNGHVAIDVFESRLPLKPRVALRILTNLIIFLPTVGLLTIWAIIYARDSWGNWELASTSWAPPLYPFKTIMAIGFLLLFLQGIAKLLQDVHVLRDNNG